MNLVEQFRASVAHIEPTPAEKLERAGLLLELAASNLRATMTSDAAESDAIDRYDDACAAYRAAFREATGLDPDKTRDRLDLL